jgi:ATP-binding cassette subfamily B protein
VRDLRWLGPSQIVRALQVVWTSSPGWTAVGIALLVVQALLAVASLGALKLVVDGITAALATAQPLAAFDHVALLIALAAGIGLLTVLSRSLEDLVAQIQRDRVSDYIHGLVHSKAVELDLEYYENADYYTALHRAQAEAPRRAPTILADLLQVGRSSASLVAIGGLLLAFNWWVALVLLIGDLPGAVIKVRGAWEYYHWQRRRTPVEMRAGYYSELLSLARWVQEMRLFGLGPLFMERFRGLRSRLRQEHQTFALRRLGAEAPTQVCAMVAMYLAYGFVGYQTLAGALTLGDLVMYFAAFQRGQGYLHELLSGLARSYEDNLFLSDLFGFLALKQTVAEPVDPQPVPRPLRSGLVFDHVDFRYPGDSRLALDDVCLAVRPGERIAIVGPNGSGKTTLVKLLCRFYDPAAGQITADGLPLSAFAKAAWRREISALFQEHGKYYLSARENIWLGNPVPMTDDGPIVAAARSTGAHEAIEDLPSGYDTVLGKWLDEGAELSVGEWQKIALARAYLRDAQILVLDEPTSALDPLAEQELLDTFWRVAEDRITIIISHRLSTVRMADHIYVLDEGRIVEAGTHDELLRLNGRYAELFLTQARHYQ